jgi:type II secretory pathway pseudopilin PulG
MPKKNNDNQNNRGFSITEMLVIIALITVISGVVLINFRGLNEGVALNRAAREMALNFRRAQNMALAVTYVNFGGSRLVPGATGLRFQTCPPATACLKYWLFGDLGNPRNDLYNSVPPPDEKIGNDITLEHRIKISDITVYNGTVAVAIPAGIVHVLFLAPEAVVRITRNNGTILGDRIDITLQTLNGQTRKVVVRGTSGQISVR